MPLERNDLAKFLAILVLAALSMPPAVWANDGGAGISYGIDVGDYSEDDEEEEIVSLTARPVGFDSGLTFDYGLSARLRTDLTYGVAPIDPALWSGITLDGPSLRDDEITYITPRFNTRFPGIAYTYTPSNSGSSTNQAPRETRPQTWASESASESLDLDNFTRDLRINFENLTPEEAAAAFFGVSPERARVLIQDFEQFMRQERARNFLGDESYRKLQEQFGPVNTDASGASDKTQVATTDSARDLSGWDSGYLYCGGACVGRY